MSSCTPPPTTAVVDSKATTDGKGETDDDKCLYELEERVLCFHGPLIYEAKVLKHRQRDRKWNYFVHYNGWNKNWDEWVDCHRILKLNDHNLQIQKDLKSKHQKPSISSSNKKRKTSMQTIDRDINGQPIVTNEVNSCGKRAKNDRSDRSVANGKDNTNSETSEKKKKWSKVPDFVESEEAFNSKPEIRIKIPEELKPCLVDDWDLITRQQKLLELPARITVDQILDDYLGQKLATKLTPSKESAVQEVVTGMRQYFNAMIGSQLLYRFERMQYQEQLQEVANRGGDNDDNPSVKLSSIYGSIHLLRLFTKLGHFLAFTALDEKTIQTLLGHINDFLKYLSRNSLMLFNSNDYSVASPEYIRKTIN